MIAAVAVLLLIATWNYTNGVVPLFIMAVLAAVALTAAYSWRWDRRAGVALGVVHIVLFSLCWLGLAIGAAVGESRAGRPPLVWEALYLSLLPVLGMIVLASLFRGADRPTGIVVGVCTSLVVGRTLSLLVPDMEAFALQVPSAAAFGASVGLPVYAGGLVGLVLGDYAARCTGLWKDRKLWAVVAVIAGVGIGLRVLDVATGNYRAYTSGELAAAGKSDALVRRITSSSDPTARWAAIKALGESGGSGTGDVLVRRMRDPDARVRAAAAENLQFYSSPDEVPALIAVLDDKDEDVQSAAARSLGKTGDVRAFDALVARLDDSRTRSAAISGLGTLGDGRAVPYLAKFLGYEWHATHAMWTIRDLNDPSALEPMVKVLEHDGSNMWYEAAKIVSSFGGNKRIRAAMIAHLDDERTDNRLQAIELLCSYGDASVIPHLRKSAENDPAEEVRVAAEAALKDLEEGLKKHERSQ